MADWTITVISTGHTAEQGLDLVDYEIMNDDGLSHYRGQLQLAPGVETSEIEEILRARLLAAKEASSEPKIKIGHTVVLEKKKLRDRLRRNNNKTEK